VKQAVLIVDDSLTVRMDLSETFESAGYQVTACDTLQGARSALAGGAFSLVILDVLLPDGDGLSLLREIKQSPERTGPAVILLSTEAEVRDRVRGLEIGADDYIGKPYDSARVLARARQLANVDAPAQIGTAPTLLLIDDSATFRSEFQEVLEGRGYHVVTAETGEEGLRAAVASRPAGVIVDGMLPGGIDGATVIRRLKQDLIFRDTPCLLLTAAEKPGDELRTLEAGADAYIRKDTEIDVILARILALLRPAASTGPAEPSAFSLLGPNKILAVDDSPTYLNELAGELRQEGYDTILASSGKEALDLLKIQIPDCILLDLMMPGLSGQQTCQLIKQNETWRHIPVVILTAVEEAQAMIEGINAGADDYIPKSSAFDVLKARVRAQLRRKQFEEEYRAIQHRLLEKELQTAEAIRALNAALENRVQQRTADLKLANEELESFSYSVSHDLRAPLRAIDGFSKMLLEDFGDHLPAEGQRYLKVIHQNTAHMTALIDDLLALSRLGRTAITKSRVSIGEIVCHAIEDLQPEQRGRAVEFIVGELPCDNVDPLLVRQVFVNLLSNALKYTRPREKARIEIGATTVGSLRDGGMAPGDLPEPQADVYFVRDNGVGFDMKYADRLFGAFQRLHHSEDFEGNGIGLATVQRIVRKHGGRVWVNAAVDRGAVFYFTLGE
jgi:two-component system, NtrC family, sensor kinase